MLLRLLSILRGLSQRSLEFECMAIRLLLQLCAIACGLPCKVRGGISFKLFCLLNVLFQELFLLSLSIQGLKNENEEKGT